MMNSQLRGGTALWKMKIGSWWVKKSLSHYSDMWPSKAQPYLKNPTPDYLLFLIRGKLHQLVNQLIIN